MALWTCPAAGLSRDGSGCAAGPVTAPPWTGRSWRRAVGRRRLPIGASRWDRSAATGFRDPLLSRMEGSGGRFVSAAPVAPTAWAVGSERSDLGGGPPGRTGCDVAGIALALRATHLARPRLGQICRYRPWKATVGASGSVLRKLCPTPLPSMEAARARSAAGWQNRPGVPAGQPGGGGGPGPRALAVSRPDRLASRHRAARDRSGRPRMAAALVSRPRHRPGCPGTTALVHVAAAVRRCRSRRGHPPAVPPPAWLPRATRPARDGRHGAGDPALSDRRQRPRPVRKAPPGQRAAASRGPGRRVRRCSGRRTRPDLGRRGDADPAGLGPDRPGGHAAALADGRGPSQRP